MIVEAIEANNPELRLALGGAATPVNDLDDAHRTFFRFVDEGQTIGFAGLETYGPNALLRSLVILPEARSIGLGRRATGLFLEQARAAGAAHAYLLTIDAVPFFADMGFEVVVRLDAPAEILATRQAESLCSSTAVLMARPI